MVDILQTSLYDSKNNGETHHYWNTGIILLSSPEKYYRMYIWINEEKERN